MILGICGRKQHGKDTFASELIKNIPTFRKASFATRLKEICAKVYGLNMVQFEDEAGKGMLLANPIDLDSKLQELRWETGLVAITAHGLVANTPRQVLQYIGTDYVRSVDPGYWLRVVAAHFGCHPQDDYVVPDVRFSNEAETLRKAGGKILRIVRFSKVYKGEEKVEHASEAFDFEPDFSLMVMENDFFLSKLLCGLASSDKTTLFTLLASANWDAHTIGILPALSVYYRDLVPAIVDVFLERPLAKELSDSRIAVAQVGPIKNEAY